MNESNLLMRKKSGETPFVGEIAAADFIDGVTLAAAIGLSAGTAINTTTNWLQFSYNGKTLYIPKLPVRQGVSFSNIYTAKAAYGTGISTDARPSGQAAVVQSAQVTIGSNTFIVRLIQGYPANPTAFTAGGQDAAMAVGSEWNALYYPITNDSKIVTYTGPKIANPYNLIDLGFDSSFTQTTFWVGNTFTGAGYTSTGGLRGSSVTVTNAGAQTYTSGTGSAAYGWRPCLELVPSA